MDFSHDNLIPIVGIIAGCSVAGIAIIFGCVQAIANRRQREQSRREIAAYVAEGSMSPDDAERILRAETPSSGKCG
ncbi:MAG: hypothetical protein D6692_13845 [Planctomycetota bacterium]|nr:MAG: hypothetical protein D6692_13845 [Planctomycetota bacterium]